MVVQCCMDRVFNWNDEKNALLIKDRGISFEEVVFYINNGALLDEIEHPNREKYPNQMIYVIQASDYVYLVPYVENGDEIFLKTIIPSRKARKQYKGGSQ
jgi:uncharacterized DUF497 family protein